MDQSEPGRPRGPQPPLVDQERSGPPWTRLRHFPDAPWPWGGRGGEIKVHFWGKASPGAGNVVAEGLDKGGISPDGAVRVNVGHLFQQEVSGSGAGRAAVTILFSPGDTCSR